MKISDININKKHEQLLNNEKNIIAYTKILPTQHSYGILLQQMNEKTKYISIKINNATNCSQDRSSAMAVLYSIKTHINQNSTLIHFTNNKNCAKIFNKITSNNNNWIKIKNYDIWRAILQHKINSTKEFKVVYRSDKMTFNIKENIKRINNQIGATKEEDIIPNDNYFYLYNQNKIKFTQDLRKKLIEECQNYQTKHYLQERISTHFQVPTQSQIDWRIHHYHRSTMYQILFCNNMWEWRPTASKLKQRQQTTSDKCQLCGDDDETNIHLNFYCNRMEIVDIRQEHYRTIRHIIEQIKQPIFRATIMKEIFNKLNIINTPKTVLFLKGLWTIEEIQQLTTKSKTQYNQIIQQLRNIYKILQIMANDIWFKRNYICHQKQKIKMNKTSKQTTITQYFKK